MFAVLSSIIYGFFEKRLKRKFWVTLCYFLTLGLVWAFVTFCVTGLSMGRSIILGKTDAAILLLAPIAGFILGDIFAFFPWITGLGKSGDRTGNT